MITGSVGNTFRTEKGQIVYCRGGTGEIWMIISPLMELWQPIATIYMDGL